ncbi:MAG: protein kinase [Phycisphaerae bacterium]
MSNATKPEKSRRLGDFEVVREIGRGGMGIVYEARQVSLNRKVALKVLSGSLGLTSRAVVRFRREAEAAAKLHHTNIVPVYATGEEDGTHYYAMELIEGPSLSVVIRQMRNSVDRAGVLPARGDPENEPQARDRATSAGADVTQTTTEASRILPSWLAETLTRQRATAGTLSTVGDSSTTLTTGGGYFDTVARMIADVADALDYAHDQGVIHRDIKPSNLLLSPDGKLSINDFGLARMLEQPGMTTSGEFVGSPLYMSPEQITAGRAPLDHRTDIYSLGATLYELLAMQPPFPGERRDQVVAQIIHKEPRRPRRVNKKVPLDLETICLKALEKDPDRRYQSAGQMAEDLRRFVNRFAISAKRAGPLARSVKWVRRRPAVAALGALVLLVSAAAGLLAYRSHLVAEKARVAEGQRALDQALVEVLSGRYDQVERWLEKAEVLDVDPGRIRVLRGLAAVERGAIRTAIHELELAVRQLPDSLGAYALLLRAYMEDGQFDNAYSLFPEIERMTPVTTEDRLYGAWAVGWWSRDQAMQWLEQLALERPTPAVHYMLGLYRVFELWDSYDPEEIEKTLADVSAAKTQMPFNVRAICFHFFAHLTAADIYRLHGDAVRWQIHLEEARKDAAHLLEHHADVGDSHAMNKHLAEFELRWEDALAHQRTAVALPRLWALQRYTLPRQLYRLGRYAEALAELDAMPDGLKASATWVRDRAFLVAELHGPDEAEATYRQWLENSRAFSTGRQVRYEIYRFLGRPVRALKFAREGAHEVRPPFRQERFDIAVDRHARGELSAEALVAAAGNHSQRMRAHYLLGLAQLSKGDRAGALRHFAEVENAGCYTLSYQPWAYILRKRLREDPTWPPWIPLKDATGEDAGSPAANRPDS